MHPDYISPQIAVGFVALLVIFSLTRKVVLCIRRRRAQRRSRLVIGI